MINLADILATPTEHRQEVVSSAEPNTNIPNGLEFSERPEIEPQEEIQAVEEEEFYDAESEAKKLVSLINAGNMLAFVPLGRYKTTKSHGGKKAIALKKACFYKKQAGQKLTEHEERLAASFLAYQSENKEVDSEAVFTPAQIEILVNAAIPMMEETRMKINSKFGFYGILMGMEASKLTKILMK